MPSTPRPHFNRFTFDFLTRTIYCADMPFLENMSLYNLAAWGARDVRVTHPERIFVAVAAYRDEEAQWTVTDLLRQAAHPDRIRVGIVWQARPRHKHEYSYVQIAQGCCNLLWQAVYPSHVGNGRVWQACPCCDCTIREAQVALICYAMDSECAFHGHHGRHLAGTPSPCAIAQKRTPRMPGRASRP